MRNLLAITALVFYCGAIASTNSYAQDSWPQWRGPNLDNVSAATNLPAEFNKDKNLLWRHPLPGPAGSSPVVYKDSVFVTTVVDSDDSLQLVCVGLDGSETWTAALGGKNKKIRMDSANSASASPFTDGDHVWATTSAGFLECFDMLGESVWSKDLQEAYGDFQIQFGMSSTPVLHDGVIYMQMIHGRMRDRSKTSVGTVAALNAKTGDEIWSVKRETDGHSENKHSYASPTLVMDGETKYLVTHGGDYVIGHSLDDGSELWRCGGINPRSSYNPYLRFVSSPTFAEGQLIVPSAKNGPVFSMKPTLSGDVTESEEVFNWKLTQGTPDVASPLIHDGLVFLARENGVLLCVDAKTGEQIYEKRMFADRHRSTPVYADGKVFVVGRDGTVVVVSADREGAELGRNELNENATSSPAIVDGKIFVRTESALYCFGK